MPAEPPFHTYREQLGSLYQGLALWKPNPGDLYARVSIGDVGYVSEGAFIRMFNVRLPWDDESNGTLGIPDQYDPLGFDHLNIRRETFGEVDHYSRCVFRDENANNIQAASPEQADGVAYSCRGRGALLSLPHGGLREDAVQMKIFRKYIQDNVVSWFTWAQNNHLDVERMEELILVTGCTLVTTWAAAVFIDHTMSAEISLTSRTLSKGGASFVWSNVRGPIIHHNSRFDPQHSPTAPDQCVFIKGFRAKRVLFRIRPLRAAAEPLPDDPDNGGDGDIDVSPIPGVPKYRDPLIGVLDYIAEKCIEGAIDDDTIAIAHDNDLCVIEDIKIVTADEIEKHLHERNMPLLVENGAAIMRVPRNNTSPVSNEKQVAPYEAAESNMERCGVSDDICPLPTLPQIRSEQIRKRIFTHSSCLPDHKHEFQAPEGDPPVDNEEFGHLGDQVLALAATDAIQTRYPHLRADPASKVRDLIMGNDMLAKICTSYGLHMGLNLPERQACDLRVSQNVQVDVFLAYIGGVYRDQGAEVASDWLIPLLQPHVEDAYQSVLEDHLRPPDTPRQLETPDSLLSVSVSESPKGGSPALPSLFARGPRDHRQLLTQANVPRQTEKPLVRLRPSSRNSGGEEASTANHEPGSQRIVRHAKYYIHGGDIIFRVEDTLFRVHRYFFMRESAFFRSMLSYPPPPQVAAKKAVVAPVKVGESTKGASDYHPFVLEDTLRVDFERFLWVFYNPTYSRYDATVEEWTSILKLALKWDFIEVKNLALRGLEQLSIPPLRKIVLYNRYAIDCRLLQEAYTALAVRDEPITIEEALELGMETVLKLARARELVRAPATGGGRIKDARSPVNAAGAELKALIWDIFQPTHKM